MTEALTASADVLFHRAVSLGTPCDLHAIDFAQASAAELAARTVTAEQVRDEVLRASRIGTMVALTGARISGRLDLRSLELRMPVSLQSSWFDAGVTLDFADLPALDLTGSRIGPGADGVALSARAVNVRGDLVLESSWFEGRVQMHSADVRGSICCGESRICLTDEAIALLGEDDWSLDLTNASVHGDIDLVGSETRGGVSIAGVDVVGQIDLSGASLRGRVVEGIHRSMSLWGQRCSVGESVLAWTHSEGASARTTFEGEVSLVGATIVGGLFLGGASFEGIPTGAIRRILDLRRSTMQRLDLEGATSSIGTRVDLGGATIEHLTPGTTLWQTSNHRIDGTSYQHLDGSSGARFSWVEAGVRKGTDGEDHPGPFLVLARSAESQGDTRLGKQARIAASSVVASPAERRLFGWLGYGYRPYRAGYPLLVLGLLTWVLVLGAMSHHEMYPSSTSSGRHPHAATCRSSDSPCLHSTLYAVDAVLPVDLGQVSGWHPIEQGVAGTMLGWLIPLDEILSWALAGAFLAAVGGYLKRTE